MRRAPPNRFRGASAAARRFAVPFVLSCLFGANASMAQNRIANAESTDIHVLLITQIQDHETLKVSQKNDAVYCENGEVRVTLADCARFKASKDLHEYLEKLNAIHSSHNIITHHLIEATSEEAVKNIRGEIKGKEIDVFNTNEIKMIDFDENLYKNEIIEDYEPPE